MRMITALIFDVGHTLAGTTAKRYVAQEQLAVYCQHTWNDELEQLVRGVHAYDLAAVHAHVRARTPVHEAQRCMRAALRHGIKAGVRTSLATGRRNEEPTR